ncbi:MAG: hypothetical protein B5M56_05855 [Desulfococcus sp. 4484_241]|nr:MAG: hypothetical protein B5M56_05855 [Desulfococcus sp. 4484_241]
MNLAKKIALFLATGCLVGYFPVAPGTLGSVEGVLLAFFVSGFTPLCALLFLIVFTALSMWISHIAEKAVGRKDPGCIVIDEIAGMMAAMLWLPFTVKYAIACFITFRVLDIIKPFPIRYIESRLPGGIGIVADDLVAGVAANLLVRGLFAVFGLF